MINQRRSRGDVRLCVFLFWEDNYSVCERYYSWIFSFLKILLLLLFQLKCDGEIWNVSLTSDIVIHSGYYWFILARNRPLRQSDWHLQWLSCFYVLRRPCLYIWDQTWITHKAQARDDGYNVDMSVKTLDVCQRSDETREKMIWEKIWLGFVIFKH